MRRTICAVFQRLDFDSSSAVAAAIFCVFADVLPGEVCAEPVDFPPVVANEKDEVLGGEVASAAAGCQSACLDDLVGRSMGKG